MEAESSSSPRAQKLFNALSNSAIYIAVIMVLVAGVVGAYYFGPHHRDIIENSINPALPAPPQVVPSPRASKIELPANVPSAIGPETVADVAAAVSPSVVSIDVYGQVPTALGSSETDFFFNGTRIAP